MFYENLVKQMNETWGHVVNGWENTSWGNDACGSIGVGSGDFMVQLYAFESKEDAIGELGEDAKLYAITVWTEDGDQLDGCTWHGDDLEEAMKMAVRYYLAYFPITDEASAKGFTLGLAHMDMMFHFDDEAEDCLREYNFPKTLVDGIQSQVNKLHVVLDDPFEYAIDAFHAVDPDGEKDIDEMVNDGSALSYKFCVGLEEELNKRTNQIEPEWEYCAFGTPTQQVVMYEFGMDDDFPTYVWLVISPNGYVEEGLHFSVIVSVNGERDTVYEGKDRNTAIAFAIAKAIQIENEWVPNTVETV